MDGNTSGFAKELVMCGFVRVLKSSPTANVVDKDHLVGCGSRNDILQELLKPSSMPQD
jgi:hypothetical protein